MGRTVSGPGGDSGRALSGGCRLLDDVPHRKEPCSHISVTSEVKKKLDYITIKCEMRNATANGAQL